jgi:hypothetical protein
MFKTPPQNTGGTLPQNVNFFRCMIYFIRYSLLEVLDLRNLKNSSKTLLNIKLRQI